MVIEKERKDEDEDEDDSTIRYFEGEPSRSL
jgi:hypothetical protein